MSLPEERQAAIAARVTIPLRKASDLITGKIADAGAHALVALTETLKATPDGRPTLGKVKTSRSFLAARTRLIELAAELVGQVADAREAFYRDSFAWWAKHLPADVHRSTDPQPRTSDIAKVRTFVLHGMTLRNEIGIPTLSADQRMFSTLVMAGSRAARGKDSSDLIRAWAERSTRSLIEIAVTALADSSVRCDYLAGRDVLDPDLLEPDPTL